MANQAAQFDLSTAFLDIPKTIAYGLVRGAGNLILQQELTDKTRVSFYMLGEGPWGSLLRLWVNNKVVTLPSSTTVHFHPGLDGEIGNGLTANSTGGDQHVDQFFTLIPGGLDPITFSRYAWLALKTAPDPGAPSAQLTVLADYQAMQVRQFDSSGNQTSFAWTQNWAWNICDFLIRKFVLREGKVNQPLVAAEIARFDWASFSAAATYYDAVLSGGQKRFSDGGVVFLNDSDTADRALEQLLLLSRSYLLERNGKLSLYADQARASVFTFTSDNTAPLSSKIVPSANVASSAGGKLAFKGRKSNLRAATNRLTATYRDLNIASGSTDDATRFAISTLKLDHEAHQRTVGARGPGLSVLPKVTELALDLGVNTPERVWRILKGMLVRQLGDDVDANTAYNAPFSADWTGYEDSLAVEPGDVVTIDKSISEEFGGTLIEVLQIEEVPDGTRNFTGLEYMPNAFPDVAPAVQLLQAPVPGIGLNPSATSVDGGGNLIVSMDLTADGATFGRPIVSRLNAGKPWIDFAEAIHANKNLDNVADGTRAAWDSGTMKAAAVDTSGNIKLKNVTNADGPNTVQTTNSGTYVDLTNMAITVTTKGNPVLILFSGTCGVSIAGNSISMKLQLDGVDTGVLAVCSPANTSGQPIALTHADVPSAGSHTYKIQWKVTGGVASMFIMYSMQVVELG
jgi:hypothetical protein